jgi:hypothetical protein
VEGYRNRSFATLKDDKVGATTCRQSRGEDDKKGQHDSMGGQHDVVGSVPVLSSSNAVKDLARAE